MVTVLKCPKNHRTISRWVVTALLLIATGIYILHAASQIGIQTSSMEYSIDIRKGPNGTQEAPVMSEAARLPVTLQSFTSAPNSTALTSMKLPSNAFTSAVVTRSEFPSSIQMSTDHKTGESSAGRAPMPTAMTTLGWSSKATTSEQSKTSQPSSNVSTHTALSTFGLPGGTSTPTPFMTVESVSRTPPATAFLLPKTSNISDTSKVSVKKILYFNGFFDVADYEFGFGRLPFVKNGCPVNNCETVKNQIRSKTYDADAIIFHSYFITPNMKNLKPFTEKRRPNQRYVFFLMEAPGVYVTNLKEFNGFFNWTMTYRMDSDIYRPYGFFQLKNSTEQHVEARKTLDQPWISPSNQTLRPAQYNKTNLIAWFVTKCKTPSIRESYVAELMKYIPIDVYGKCGPLKCVKTKTDKCYRMLERTYKFYLSFENSLCRDYVTEKLFNVMRYRVVPIVYGGADYKRIAPPGSYIDTRDFASPRALAEYLKMLDANPDKYNEYFRWKETYTVNVAPMSSAMCKLCEMLNDPLQPTKSYPNLQEWYSSTDMCHNSSSHWNNANRSNSSYV